MYDLPLVKKRRRRKIASFVALFSAIGITALVIVSFLGRTVGTFTVSLKNTDVSLSLSETKSFDQPSSYLHLGKLNGLRETSFDSLPAHAILDDEKTPYDYGKILDEKGNIDSLQFIKYTFYIRNVGNSPAEYNLAINITDRTESKDDTYRVLDDTLRVMVYENDGSDDNAHDYTVYAKETPAGYENTDKYGNKTNREFISGPVPSSHREDDEHPLAETFLSTRSIAKYNVKNFAKGDIKRYTIVLWLEGYDEDSSDDEEYPEGATIKLGVNIAAYENV